MTRVRYVTKDIDLLARLMRSEALGEGAFGMKLVGNVTVNRIVATCLNFKNINTVSKAVYQKGQFEGVGTPLFNASPNGKERQMATDCLKFWRAHPAYAALFFQNPGKGKPCKERFWGTYSGRFKNHCFYNPDNINACNL